MRLLASRLCSLLSGKYAVPALLVLYLIPRALVLLVAVEPTSDAAWYFNRAVVWATGGGYSEGGLPTAFWPPGWPMVLMTLFKLFGASVLVGQLFNLACSLVAGWLTLDLGRRLFHSELAGRVALLLLALYPNSIAYVPLLLTEVFYTTLLLAICWLLVLNRSFLHLFLAGLILGFATLVKTQSLALIPFIFAIEVLRHCNFKKATRSLGQALLVGALALLVVLPWSYRNYRTFGQFLLVSANGGLTLLSGNNPSARGDYTPDDPLMTSIPRSVATQLQVDREARRRAMGWIEQNPEKFALSLPRKFFRLWAPDGEAEWGFQGGYKSYGKHAMIFHTIRYLNQLYYAGLITGFAWAGLLLWSGRVRLGRSRIDWWGLPYSLALYVTVIALIASGQSRFHYPNMPFIIMACGWSLVSLCMSMRHESTDGSQHSWTFG